MGKSRENGIDVCIFCLKLGGESWSEVHSIIIQFSLP